MIPTTFDATMALVADLMNKGDHAGARFWLSDIKGSPVDRRSAWPLIDSLLEVCDHHIARRHAERRAG